MAGTLHVVEDDQGGFREVDNRPMIVIFASKPRHPKRSHASKHPSRAAEHRAFAFINVLIPGEEDEASRQLIRTHAATQQSCSSSKLSSPISKGHSLLISSVMPRERSALSTPLQPSTASVSFPIQMQPYMRKLIHQYASSMQMTNPRHPANPVDSAFFPMVMADPALFHAILCTSAIYVGLLSGKEEAFLQSKHMMESISLINARLRHTNGAGRFSDATLTTILVLAKAEYVQRNYANWGVHMNGLKKIVELRGGMMALPSLIRQKIYEAELLGCIESGSIPRFPFIGDSSIFGPSIASRPLSIGFENLAHSQLLDRGLYTIVSDIEASKYTYAPTVDLGSAIDNDRYRLLAWVEQDVFEKQYSTFQQCIRYGAFLYLSTLLPRSPVRCVDYNIMKACLRSHILTLEPGCFAITESLLWLLCIGGIAAKETEQAWFASQLLDTAGQAYLKTWDDLKLILTRFWWIDSAHEGPGLQLWGMVEALRAKASHNSSLEAVTPSLW